MEMARRILSQTTHPLLLLLLLLLQVEAVVSCIMGNVSDCTSQSTAAVLPAPVLIASCVVSLFVCYFGFLGTPFSVDDIQHDPRVVSDPMRLGPKIS